MNPVRNLPNNTKINTKSLFYSFFSFLVLIFLSYFFYYLFSKIKLLSVEMGAAKRSMIVLNEKSKSFDLAKKNLESYDEAITTIKKAFVSESEFVDFLNAIEQLSKKSGTKFKAKEARLPSQEGEAEISFTVTGTFSSIARFLSLLDNFRYSGIVSKFILFKEKENSEIFTADIDYLIFNYK